MSDFANPRYDLRYVGSEVFNGQRVPHIRMRRQFYSSRIEIATALGDLSQVDLYIDASTLMVVKRAQLMPSFQDMKITFPLEQTYSDYRAVGGIMIPHAIATFVHGQKVSEFRFTSAATNQPVAASDFEVQQ